MTGTTHVDQPAVELDFEEYRRELTAYCYRMLGSAFEADDAVQETFVRAWRAFDSFEGRASLRSWLYRIATNVCFDSLKGRNRRALPIDMMAVGSADGPVDPPLPESTWIGPIPDGADREPRGRPRGAGRGAGVGALGVRRRACSIFRRASARCSSCARCWSGRRADVADLLDTTVVSVNSALQRARTDARRARRHRRFRRGARDARTASVTRPATSTRSTRFDLDSLVALLQEDATMSMPPYPLWLRGAEEMRAWLGGPGSECRGSRLATIAANGSPAFAQWRRDPDGGFHAWSIHVLQLSGDRIAGIDFFVDPDLFPLFGLPVRLAD